MRIIALSFILIGCLSNPLLSQDRCATVPYMQNLLKKHGINESTEQFEQWLKQKIEKRRATSSNLRTATGPYQIPVVVHIIANNDDGTFGASHESITNARVISQINVLNNDFQRLNADKTDTPSEFELVAGSMDIEFVLAKSDPNGDLTTGIIRKYVNKLSWSPDSEDSQLKATSYWPSDDYLNLWVANLSSNYIGYAQFPFSDLVSGLEDNKPALTDGVAIDYTAFGVGSSDSQFNLGRTATHEIAHYLGLRHIWGDDSGCIASGDGSDYVDDTPNQADATTGCPAHPQVDCSTNKMFQNYLDYTDDACMNLFTQGQVDRMITVLENSERRSSLLVSPGLVGPSGLGEDLKISSIISPSPVTCSSAELKFTIHNIGSPTITSFKVNHQIDNGSFVTTEFPNVNYPDVIILSGEDNVQITIPLTISEGEHALSFEIHSPNGVADANPNNSDTTINVLINDNQDFIPLRETFSNNSFNNWSVANPQDGILWNFNQSLARVSTQTGILGEQSWLVSPLLDFQNINEASLVFNTDKLSWEGNNRLRLYSSVDCGNTYQSLSFESTSSEKKYASLTSLAGISDVRIAFVATNDLGDNNIDVDNIEFFISDNPIQLDEEIKRYIVYWVDKGNADITFNLPERQTVGFRVLDTMGRILAESTLPNMLNQTIRVPVGESSTGLYIIHMHIGSKYYTTKVYLSP